MALHLAVVSAYIISRTNAVSNLLRSCTIWEALVNFKEEDGCSVGERNAVMLWILRWILLETLQRKCHNALAIVSTAFFHSLCHIWQVNYWSSSLTPCFVIDVITWLQTIGMSYGTHEYDTMGSTLRIIAPKVEKNRCIQSWRRRFDRGFSQLEFGWLEGKY